MKQRFRIAIVAVVVAMASIGTLSYELRPQVHPAKCRRDNTGNPCLVVERCVLQLICRTDIYRYPERPKKVKHVLTT